MNIFRFAGDMTHLLSIIVRGIVSRWLATCAEYRVFPGFVTEDKCYQVLRRYVFSCLANIIATVIAAVAGCARLKRSHDFAAQVYP